MNQLHELGKGDYFFLAFIVISFLYSISSPKKEKVKYKSWSFSDPGSNNDSGIHSDEDWGRLPNESEGLERSKIILN